LSAPHSSEHVAEAVPEAGDSPRSAIGRIDMLQILRDLREKLCEDERCAELKEHIDELLRSIPVECLSPEQILGHLAELERKLNEQQQSLVEGETEEFEDEDFTVDDEDDGDDSSP